MVSTEDVLAHLIAKLAEVYPKPKQSEAEGIAIRVAAACEEHVTAESLEQLAERIITTRQAKTFPNLPTLLLLVKGISRPGAIAVVQGRTKGRKSERWGGRDWVFPLGGHGDAQRAQVRSEAERNAVAFLRGRTIATEAIAARWAVGLLDFAVREGREPDPAEEQRIITKVRANDVDVREVTGKVGEGLWTLRAEMHARATRDLTSDAPRPGAGHSNGDRG